MTVCSSSTAITAVTDVDCDEAARRTAHHPPVGCRKFEDFASSMGFASHVVNPAAMETATNHQVAAILLHK